MALVIGGAMAAAAHGSSPPQGLGCSAVRGYTVARTATVRVYRVKTGGVSRTVACWLPTRRGLLLDDGSCEWAYEPPALQVRGQRLAFSTLRWSCDPTDDNEWGVVHVVDVRTRQPLGPLRDAHGQAGSNAMVAPGGDEGQRPASVALASSGSVAWITCLVKAIPGDRHPFHDLRHDGCTRPPGSFTVYIWDAGAASPRAIDHGRRIDPLSLKERNGRLTWTHSGRRNSIPFP